MSSTAATMTAAAITTMRIVFFFEPASATGLASAARVSAAGETRLSDGVVEVDAADAYTGDTYPEADAAPATV
jgi:hypothetical protein